MATKEKNNLLDVVPFRSTHITTEWEDDCIVIVFPRFKYEWMKRFMLPRGLSADIKVRLEEHGTAVWQLIDGERSVGEIIEKLAEHFENETNYESRVTTYIAQLQKDGFIIYLLPDQP